jgi:hypothetical protein
VRLRLCSLKRVEPWVKGPMFVLGWGRGRGVVFLFTRNSSSHCLLSRLDFQQFALGGEEAREGYEQGSRGKEYLRVQVQVRVLS